MHRLILIHILAVLLCGSASAQPMPPLFRQSLDKPADFPTPIDLWESEVPLRFAKHKDRAVENRGKSLGVLDRWITGVSRPTLSLYQANASNTDQPPHPAAVICPGGGYYGLAIDKEGHDTARWLNSLGITAVVLESRTAPFKVGAPKADVQQAIQVVRQNAKQWRVDPRRIGVVGYSAGGHLASTAGTHFADNLSARPDFMILVYAVTSLEASITHRGSRNNVIGERPSRALVAEYSNDLRVTKATPPTYLVHALDDSAVPIEHSRRFASALENLGIPVTLDTYETGGHGFGLGVNGGQISEWPGKCAKWLEEQGITNRPSE